MLRQLAWLGCLLPALAGCAMLPEIAHEPTLHNPFPQLSKVAVAPFFNLSHEPTLDGRRVAAAYFNELQNVPGFEVVPVGVVERAIQDNRLMIRGPADARRLAQILDVDAVVIGAVTDYSPYYPPRMALQVEWYAANPCFHPIPPGYGLPWGTPGEQDLPASLIFEAEMALAKAQLQTQTPHCEKLPPELPAPNGLQNDTSGKPNQSNGTPAPPRPAGVQQLNYQAAEGGVPAGVPPGPAAGAGVPPDWPDPRGFVPPPPGQSPPKCRPSDGPVLRHTRTYNGHDSDFTQALASYYHFRDDARLGGWQSYLQRSDDFVRFCCHVHVWQMLSARGGAGETRVVWRWPTIR